MQGSTQNSGLAKQLPERRRKWGRYLLCVAAALAEAGYGRNQLAYCSRSALRRRANLAGHPQARVAGFILPTSSDKGFDCHSYSESLSCVVCRAARSASEGHAITQAILRAGSVDEVLSHVDGAIEVAAFSHHHLSAALSKLSRLQRRIHVQHQTAPGLLAMLRSGGGLIPKLNARGLSNMLANIAVLQDVLPQVTELLPQVWTAVDGAAQDMTVNDISNVIWAYSMLQKSGRTAEHKSIFLNLQPIAVDKLYAKAEDMHPKAVVRMLTALSSIRDAQMLRSKAVPLLEHLITDKFWQDAKMESARELLVAAAKLSSEGAWSLSDSGTDALDYLAKWKGIITTKQAASLYWSCCTMGLQGSAAFPKVKEKLCRSVTKAIHSSTDAHALLQRVKDAMDSPIFDDIHWSATFARLAKVSSTFTVDSRRSEELKAVMIKVRSSLMQGQVGPRASAAILWGIASLQRDAPEVRELLPDALVAIKCVCQQMAPRQLATVVWACVRLQLREKDLNVIVPDMVESIQKQLSDIDSDNIALLLWAIASLKREASSLLVVVPKLLKRSQHEEVLATLRPESLSAILWAAAVLQNEIAEAQEAVVQLLQKQKALELASVMGSLGLANSLWACGSLQLQSFRKIEPFLARTMNRTANLTMEVFTPQSLSNLCWGLARLGRMERSLLQRVKRHTMADVGSWSIEDAAIHLPSIVFSFAKLKSVSPKMLQACASQLQMALPSSNHWALLALREALVFTKPFLQEGDAEVHRLWAEVEAERARRGLGVVALNLVNEGPQEWIRHRPVVRPVMPSPFMPEATAESVVPVVGFDGSEDDEEEAYLSQAERSRVAGLYRDLGRSNDLLGGMAPGARSRRASHSQRGQKRRATKRRR